MNPVKLSIVVPVYRSEAILSHFVEQVRQAMIEARQENVFELIFVNDSSPDDSWRVVKRLAVEHSFVKGVCLARNFGQHNATMAGLNRAQGEIVVIMDDDMQHPPASIIALADSVNAGNDVCYAAYSNRQHAAWKKWGSWFNDRVATFLLGKPSGLYLSSFKALHRRVVNEIVKYDGPYAYIDGLILDVTRHIATIEVPHQQRYSGHGNYDLRKSISLWLKMATSFSIVPLRLASLVGIALAPLSALAIVIIILNKIIHPDTQAGWTSAIAVVLFIGSLQLLCLGLLGEYLGRAYLRINRKPQYAVRETVN
jgi:glycosyltransferase involved in cell wall biosynthesis